MKLPTSMNFIPALPLPPNQGKSLIESGIFEPGSGKILVSHTLLEGKANLANPPVSLPAGVNLHPVSLPGGLGSESVAQIIDLADNFVGPMTESIEDAHPFVADACVLGLITAKGLQELAKPGGRKLKQAVLGVQLAAGAVSVLADLIPAGHAARPVLVALIKQGDQVLLGIQQEELEQGMLKPNSAR